MATDGLSTGMTLEDLREPLLPTEEAKAPRVRMPNTPVLFELRPYAADPEPKTELDPRNAPPARKEPPPPARQSADHGQYSRVDIERMMRHDGGLRDVHNGRGAPNVHNRRNEVSEEVARRPVNSWAVVMTLALVQLSAAQSYVVYWCSVINNTYYYVDDKKVALDESVYMASIAVLAVLIMAIIWSLFQWGCGEEKIAKAPLHVLIRTEAGPRIITL